MSLTRALRIDILLILAVAVFGPAHAQLRAHFIDVGQGAATLLEFPCAAVLIDTGGEKTDAAGSQKAYDSTPALLSYLDSFFARRPDLHRTLHTLILTHPHIDHTRGVAAVLDHFRALNGITNGRVVGSGKAGQIALHNRVAAGEATVDDPDDDIDLLPVSKEEVPAGVGLAGPAISGPGCATTRPRLTLLWGAVVNQGTWNDGDFGEGNNHSVVVRVDYGAASILITGDLETRAIRDLIALHSASQLLDVDGYVVGHHGSANGTIVELLQVLTPAWALIQTGPSGRKGQYTANTYGHPRTQVITDLLQSISGTRPTTFKPAATGKFAFVSRKITKAIYATGWDGTIVLEASAGGSWKKIDPSTIDDADADTAPTGMVSINVASLDQLQTLPMIGPARARAIVASRQLNGPFESLQDLTRVRGIGASTVRLLRRYAVP